MMANQYNQHLRSHYQYSLLSLSCFVTFIIFLQGPILVVAELSQYEMMMALNRGFNLNSTTTTVLNNNHDDAADENGPDIYDDDNEGYDETSTLPTTLRLRSRLTPNITSHLPAHVEEVPKSDYEDESDSYPNESNDDETTNPDDTQVFGDRIANNPSQTKPDIMNSNKKNGLDLSTTSTSRIPFFSSNLWHDLFSKPGILVGIIGGIVIGMLSAILLVMFIIYRMRKKDEGSYALEEGPRKSPSHAYTRVSSREFFA
ncbi:unnamed protein product [Adineta steineri]|uniref:Syndecan n=1 Tax=Adineta steineri TaxID=433720 RepID=A0A814FJ45_9BILA|nr:unnamed protein product [Adineta steineri]